MMLRWGLPELPGARPGGGTGGADAGKLLFAQALEAAVGGGLRGHRPEEHLLVAQGAEQGGIRA